MSKQRYKKLEPVNIQGICIICQVNKQMSKGHGKYRPICQACHDKRYNLTRYPYQQFKKGICELCGFVPVHPCQLDVDHIDGDHDNDSPENLQTLCANCHRLKGQLNRDFDN